MSLSSAQQLLNILLARKALSVTNAALLQAFMTRWQVAGYDAITETRLLSEARLKMELAEHYSLEPISSLMDLAPKISGLEFLPFVKACELAALPIGLEDVEANRARLKIAIADPTLDPDGKMLASVTGQDIVLMVGEKSEIMRAVYSVYPPEDQLSALMKLVQPR